MIYNKYLWIMGIVFILIGIFGITQDMLIKSLGFFPLAISAFVAYDKNDPEVKNRKLREVLFTTGLVLAFLVWFFGPRIYPNL